MINALALPVLFLTLVGYIAACAWMIYGSSSQEDDPSSERRDRNPR